MEAPELYRFFKAAKCTITYTEFENIFLETREFDTSYIDQHWKRYNANFSEWFCSIDEDLQGTFVSHVNRYIQ